MPHITCAVFSARQRTLRRSGYTLIEVLIVSVIISILLTLGFSLGAQVKEKARQAHCTSNLRQLGQALQMYADDHGSDQLHFLPPAAQQLYPNYVKDKSLFVCPNDDHDKEKHVITAKTPSWWFPISYMYQYMTASSSAQNHGAGIDRIPDYILWENVYPRRGSDYPILLCPHHQPHKGFRSFWIIQRLNGKTEAVFRRGTGTEF